MYIPLVVWTLSIYASDYLIYLARSRTSIGHAKIVMCRVQIPSRNDDIDRSSNIVTHPRCMVKERQKS